MNQTATAGAREPAFQLPTEQDERDELAVFGVTLSPEGALEVPDAQCAIDASASQLLRAIGSIQRDLERYEHARAEEQALIQRRHEQLTAKLIERKVRLESIVRTYATLSDFGAAKSRSLTHGAYGVRLVPDHLSIVDKKRALGWCRLSAPDLITIKQEETLAQKKVEQHFKTTGELPDGCEFAPAHSEPFIRIATSTETEAAA